MRNDSFSLVIDENKPARPYVLVKEEVSCVTTHEQTSAERTITGLSNVKKRFPPQVLCFLMYLLTGTGQLCGSVGTGPPGQNRV